MSERINPRILIVEDSVTMRKIIHSLLNQLGYLRIDEAPDGSVALHLLRLHNYDLVLSDWYMSPVNGLQLLCEMRVDPKLSAIPFLMLTGQAIGEEVIAAKCAGASKYLKKPFNTCQLREKVEALVRH